MIQRTAALALIACSGLCGAVAHSACDYPKERPDLPDGATASSGQMNAAKRQVSIYNDEITAYLDCVKRAHDESLAALQKEGAVTEDEKIALEVKKTDVEHQRAEKHNAAVDDVTAVVENFNEQVRRYHNKASARQSTLGDALKETRNPGSTAVGQPISVLSPWGTPTRSAQLGDVTLYTWTFVNKPLSGPTYSGSVDRYGNVSMMEHSQSVYGCEVTARVNKQGTIENVTKRQLGGSSCPAPTWKSSR